MHQARLLAPTDNLDAAETLARAFQNETGWSYVIPDAKQRAQRLVGAFHLFLRDEHRKGAVFGTDGFEAVTLWRGPGQAHDSLVGPRAADRAVRADFALFDFPRA